MKKFFYAAFAMLATICGGTASAQISHGGEPLFNKTANQVLVTVFDAPQIDNNVYLEQDLAQTKGASPLRVGIVQKVDIDLVRDAEVIRDARGTHYLFAINSENATFSSVHFSSFQLPEGAEIFFYDKTGDFFLGSFNASDVMDDGTFYTQAIPGSTVYVEYNVPEGVNPGKLVIDEFVHGYKDIFQTISSTYENYYETNVKGAHGDAEGNCHINVVCDAGDDWRDQIRSVVAIEIVVGYSAYMCSGALINNTRQDKTPYVLSAYHCQEFDDGLTPRFTTYFLYQTNTCEGSTGPGNKSVNGATIKAKYSYNGGSDFLLLRLNNNIPNSYTPYFSGWDRNDISVPTSGACIHHPGGDFKKISIPRRVTRGLGNLVKFHKVYWYTGNENRGVTEQGSSGSPLFNADKRIIGQLYSGSSACDYMQGTDNYGRLDISWEGNGTTASSLQSWLDPDNTGVTVLDGINFDETPGPVGIADPQQLLNNGDNLKVYPNPSNGTVYFDVDAIGDANYKVFDLNGRCIKEGRTILTTTTQAVNLTDLPAGSYIMQLFTSSRSYTATVIIK